MMRRLNRPAMVAIGLAAVLLASSVALPAFGGPSPISIAKKALTKAKKANKRSKEALRVANQPGPKGDTGARGPTGPAGPGLGPPEAWREVAQGSTTGDACADGATSAVFCSESVYPTYEAWRNFGGNHATAAFYKDQLGIVHLKGVVASPAVFGNGSVHHQAYPARFRLFRLPAGYRPEATRIFGTVGAGYQSFSGAVEQDASARVDVEAAGFVVLEVDCAATGDDCSGNGPYVSLDGIGFRPDE